MVRKTLLHEGGGNSWLESCGFSSVTYIAKNRKTIALPRVDLQETMKNTPFSGRTNPFGLFIRATALLCSVGIRYPNTALANIERCNELSEREVHPGPYIRATALSRQAGTRTSQRSMGETRDPERTPFRSLLPNTSHAWDGTEMDIQTNINTLTGVASADRTAW